MSNPSRLILVHKHPTSARTRFLFFKEETVCGFEPLPTLIQLVDETLPQLDAPKVEEHPARLLGQAAKFLELQSDDLVIEPEFSAVLDMPGGLTRVYLAHILTIDPPIEKAAEHGAKFIDLTEARNINPVELQLLRKGYEAVLGG